ncbi:MAG: FAD-dependent oxidoreductase [Halobacteriales archaeon]|nr:FAD-dependent oxidoreductase [Halobacteriales archaeon]
MYDAIVIGGGIVGAATAYHLVREGVETLLIDRADEGRATDAGAGILAPETSGRVTDRTWGDFAVEAVAHYEQLVEYLRADGIEETGYAVCGKLTVATTPAELDAYRETYSAVMDRQQRTEHPPEETLYEVDASTAAELFPPLGSIERALYYENAARVDGRIFTDAMLEAGRTHGLSVVNESAEQLQFDGDRVTGVVTDTDEYATETVVISGGAWSGDFGDQLGVTIPIEPQRGQIIHVEADDAATGEWPIVSAFSDHYMVPWPGGRVVAGATRESGVGFVPHSTVAGTEEVLAEALRVAPGLSDARIVDMRVGLRPLTADLLPVLGGVPGVEGIELATGHGPTGLQLGPYSGKLIADRIRGDEPSTDISPFGIERFQN